jgi:hypothetical protein
MTWMGRTAKVALFCLGNIGAGAGAGPASLQTFLILKIWQLAFASRRRRSWPG